MRTWIGSIPLLLVSLASFAQVKELTLSLDHRLWVLQSMRVALLEKYTFSDFKTERSGVSIDARLDRCADEERRAPPGNLEFTDRLRRCIAGFEDFHVYLKEQSPRPTLTVGLTLGRAGRKYFVTSLHRGILKGSLDAKTLDGLLGQEVLAIDGVPVARAVGLHSLYVNGGTVGARTLRALENLTVREWLYPTAPMLELTLATGKTRLKWWSVEPVLRADARAYLAKVGIPSLVTLDPALTAVLRNRTGFEGAHGLLPLPARAGLADFVDKEGRVGLRIGLITHEGKPACYAQVLSFEPKQWRTGATTLPSFIAPFQSILPICESKKLPLILDLRANNGGDPAHAQQLLGLLVAKGASAPGTLTSGLMTRHFVEVVSKLNLGDGWPKRPRETYPLELMFEALETALAQGLRHLPFVASGNVRGEGVFNGRVVTLLTPACGSACEIMLDLLRVSGRSTFVGSHANGSGGGTQVIGGDGLPAPDWRDDRFGTITLKIPNMITVVSPRLVNAGEYFLDYSLESLRENRPFTAGPGEFFEPATGEPAREWLDKAFGSF